MPRRLLASRILRANQVCDPECPRSDAPKRTPQAAGELVDDLERLGYVVRQPDPDDRRAKRIVLTKRGRQSVAVALDTIATLEAELEDLLGSDQLAKLHASLRRILTTSRPSRDAR